MGLLDRFRRPPEKFYSWGVDFPYGLEQPDAPPQTFVPSALESAAGMISRGVSGATLDGSGSSYWNATLLMDCAYHVIVSGFWGAILTQPLTRIPSFEVLGDGRYRYTGASGREVVTADFVHVKWLDGNSGLGVGPLANSPYIRQAAIQLERAMMQESGSIVGSVITVGNQFANLVSAPPDQDGVQSKEKQIASAYQELGNLQGKTQFVSASAPERRESTTRYFQQLKWQPRFDAATPDIFRELTRAIFRAVGIPLALVEGVGSTLKLEDIRLLTFNSLMPMARRIQDASAARNIEVALGFDELDTQYAPVQKSVIVEKLIRSGYTIEDANEVAGIIS